MLLRHSGWMAWNLTLALVAVGLAVWLFRVEQRRTALWWIGVGAFALFLPNAPYVLTDLIHLRWSIQHAPTEMVVLTGVLPAYLAFLAIGMLAYVVCVELAVTEVHRHRSSASRLVIVGSIHLWCAVGVVLGRVARLNSWNAVTSPTGTLETTFATLTWRGAPPAVLAVLCAITVAYVVTRTLAVAALAWLRRLPITGARAATGLDPGRGS